MRLGAAPALALVLLGGCGGGDDNGGRFGPLEWEKQPLVSRATNLRSDRVLVGNVRNESFREVKLDAGNLMVRDSEGRRLRANAQFTAAFAHGLYGAYQKPNPLPEEERRRLGQIVTIKSGSTAPLVVAFRLRRGIRIPLRVDYGKGFLPVPSRAWKPPAPG